MAVNSNKKKRTALAGVPSGPRWLLPTNHYNLMYWLAAGVVLPEAAMDKYYADCLRSVPGWLPIFRDGVPPSAQTDANAERGMVVLLEIDLSSMTGTVQATTDSGDLQEYRFSDQLPADVTCIFVPAPLPVQRIKQVLFQTRDSLNQFRLRREEIVASTTFDVPLEVGKFPEHANMNRSWLPAGSLPSLPTLPIQLASREAAVRAVLHHFGNHGDLSLAVAKAAFSDTETFIYGDIAFQDAMNQALSHGVKREVADARIRLYWGVVDHLLSVINGAVSLEQGVLDYLDQAAATDVVAGARLKELAFDLQQLLGIGSSTTRELFEKHPGAFAHALLLFFLRKHTDELIEFDTPGVVITEADWLAAGILFGLREDWRMSPPQLRNAPGLYPAITQRMAKTLHSGIGASISLGSSQPYATLRELFATTNGHWTSRQQAAALELARTMKWTDTIETRVQLGKGSYRLEVVNGGVQITLPGEVKAVAIEVNSEALLSTLARLRWPVDAGIEAKVRSLVSVN